MAVTISPKFGFPMATAGTDPTPTRAGWMTIFDSLETKSPAFGSGTLATRPSTPATPYIWWDTTNNLLSIHPGGAGAWKTVGAPGGVAPAALAYGGAGAEGTSQQPARADHTHTLPAIKRTDLPAIVVADLPTVDVPHGGTGLATLPAGSYLRGNDAGAVVTRTPAQVLADIGAAPAAAGLPAGGTVGDVLKRTSTGYAWGTGAVTAADITDATTIGRTVLTAANQAAARTAIGAGTSNFDGSYSALTGKPTIPTTAAQVGAVALASGITVIRHGTDPNVARPAGIDVGLWIGTVEPVNAAAHDQWDDTP